MLSFLFQDVIVSEKHELFCGQYQAHWQKGSKCKYGDATNGPESFNAVHFNTHQPARLVSKRCPKITESQVRKQGGLLTGGLERPNWGEDTLTQRGGGNSFNSRGKVRQLSTGVTQEWWGSICTEVSMLTS